MLKNHLPSTAQDLIYQAVSVHRASVSHSTKWAQGCTPFAGGGHLDCAPEPERDHQFYSRSSKGEKDEAVPGKVRHHGDRSLDNWEWGAGWAQRCHQAES